MSIVNRTMYPLQSSMGLITRMQDRFAQLQVQLATGQKAGTLAEMGTDRFYDLSIRARMSRIEGYQQSAGTLNMRLAVFGEVMGRLDTVESNARTAITQSAYGSSNVNFGTAPVVARSSLDEVIHLLNTDVDGRHLFAGGKVDQRPVESIATILDGANGKAGFTQIARERLEADQGDGLGRLTLGVAGNAVALDEDGGHVFGFKLSTITASSSGIAVTSSVATQPRAMGITVNAQPAAGDSITIGLTLPDGTAHGITLHAVAEVTGPDQFAIGADADATAANIEAALRDTLKTDAKTELASASNYAAADNFFNAHGTKVQRVEGPFATATMLVDADPSTTVMWYRGEDADDARGSVKAKLDDAATVSYGAQANESGPLALVRSLAVLAIQQLGNNDATSGGRFDAIAQRNNARLSESHNNEAGSIEMISVELGIAHANADSISSRQKGYVAQLEGLLGDLEDVPKEDVAMEMLAIQTRLQASYQATALVAQLSLVNYLR